MKGFKRKNRYLSLCGLNCSLCPMNTVGYCPGCGGGEGNQSCKIAKCSLRNGNPQYCCFCSMYPCGIYESFDEYDSFITHFNRKDNFELLKEKGEDFYNDIQREKRRQLDFLLSECNDGRRKTFFCTGVNLLETRTIEEAVRELKTKPDFENMTVKEKGDFVSEKFKEAALKKGVEIKLRKSKKV